MTGRCAGSRSSTTSAPTTTGRRTTGTGRIPSAPEPACCSRPGGAQIYYGDELARPLQVAGAEGDANLRSFMNWGDLERGGATAEVLEHWRKLGRFRRAHPAVGAGVHRTLQAKPYIFSRTLESGGRVDRVLVAMDQGEGAKTIPVFGVFPEGTELVDAYSGVAWHGEERHGLAHDRVGPGAAGRASVTGLTTEARKTRKLHGRKTHGAWKRR